MRYSLYMAGGQMIAADPACIARHRSQTMTTRYQLTSRRYRVGTPAFMFATTSARSSRSGQPKRPVRQGPPRNSQIILDPHKNGTVGCRRRMFGPALGSTGPYDRPALWSTGPVLCQCRVVNASAAVSSSGRNPPPATVPAPPAPPTPPAPPAAQAIVQVFDQCYILPALSGTLSHPPTEQPFKRHPLRCG